MQESNAHYGKYRVNETAKIITFKIDHATFTNWDSTEQVRHYIYTGNEIKYVVVSAHRLLIKMA
ncbi:lipocalin-like domain-containing protein [Mucilaginibacter sp.]|uniref:lipocalin-like domain-containing protein n=1 Tax=Mucilaginibacter sp. TaxID=1882438 RepID=UPI003566BBB2